MDAPTASVILPSYNRAPLLPEVVGSVLAQSMTDFELLVVDDGSTDETPVALRELAARDARIQVLRKENGGTASARNAGAAAARCFHVR